MTSINHAALAVGYELRDYKIEEVIGSGAFGIVYRAEHIHIGTQVAIKEFMPDFAVREQGTTVYPRTEGEDADNYEWGLDAFLKEAKTLAQFNHPNILSVTDLFKANNTAYMVMEYIKGLTLDERLKQHKLFSEQGVKSLLLPILEGLKLVHQVGICHRDIKPGNIILRENGEPILIDFGAARNVLGEKTQTMMYTPGYASFEQYESKGNTGPWTDIYALAATAYHCLTGEKPIDANSRVRNDPLIPISTIQPNNSPEFNKAIEVGLNVFDDERPQNIDAWLEEILSSGSNNQDELISYDKIKVSVTKPVKNLNKRAEKNEKGQQYQQAQTLTDSVTGMTLLKIPSGCFLMGSNDGYDAEQPVHEVCITEDYYLGKYAVTQRQWEEVMGDNPSHFQKGDNHPVESVSWHDVQQFIVKLNSLSGDDYRLPTEAEWEYACRSGGKDEKFGGGDDVDSVAWTGESWAEGHHKVGGKSANGLGLYDMSGNVWEWVQDFYDEDYYKHSPRNNPTGASGGSRRGLRGGSWFNFASDSRSARRSRSLPDVRNYDIGFRLARTR